MLSSSTNQTQEENKNNGSTRKLRVETLDKVSFEFEVSSTVK